MKQKLAVAVDLGATNVRVALVSPSGEILQKLKEKTVKTGASGTVVTKQIERLVQQSKDYGLKRGTCPPKLYATEDREKHFDFTNKKSV